MTKNKLRVKYQVPTHSKSFVCKHIHRHVNSLQIQMASPLKQDISNIVGKKQMPKLVELVLKDLFHCRYIYNQLYSKC